MKIYKYLPFNNEAVPKIINIKSEYDINTILDGGFSIVKKYLIMKTKNTLHLNSLIQKTKHLRKQK